MNSYFIVHYLIKGLSQVPPLAQDLAGQLKEAHLPMHRLRVDRRLLLLRHMLPK